MLVDREVLRVEFCDDKSWMCPHCKHKLWVAHFLVGKSECPVCGGGILWLPESWKSFE